MRAKARIMSKNKPVLFRALLLMLSVVLLSCTAVIPLSAAPECPSLEYADSVYLYNTENNKVIVSKSTGGTVSPASTAKIATGLVAYELACDRLGELVTVTKEMLSGSKGTSMNLREGDVVSLCDLYYATVCGGYNDAAYALAYASAGSIGEFVHLMNEKARSLGCTETNYTNPTGYDDPAMYTTLGDVVKLSLAAMENEFYVTVSSASNYTLQNGGGTEKSVIYNRNALISTYYAQGFYNKNARGLIAGMTDAGGYCVVSFAENAGLTYLCIVMGAREHDGVIGSFDIANKLIGYAVSYCGYLKVLDAGTKVCEVPVSLAVGDSSEDGVRMLRAVVSEDVSLFLPYDSDSADTLEIKYYLYESPLRATVVQGEVIGGADFYIDGKYVASAPLCAGETVRANGFLKFMDSFKNFLTGRFFIISVSAFVILFGIYYYFTELKFRRRTTQNIGYKDIY